MGSTSRSLYDAPDYYGMLFDERSDDVQFYLRITRNCERVLEYGVGAGRVAIPLAHQGCSVLGVDVADAMLATLAERAALQPPAVQARLQWQQADMQTFDAGRVFDRVLCPFNGLAHLHSRQQLQDFFAHVHAHLAPDGLFVFDVWLPDVALLAGSTIDGPRFRDPRTREMQSFKEEFRYDPYTQVMTTKITLAPIARPEDFRVLTLTQRQFFPEETLMMLELFGFEVRWRTTRFAPPRDLSRCEDDTAHDDIRGEMLTYVCAAKRSSGR